MPIITLKESEVLNKNMAKEDLKPLNTRTKEEQREIARMGGIASGKARAEKKKLKDSISLFMQGELTGEQSKILKKINPILGEEKSLQMAVASGVIFSAMQGNMKAVERIEQIQDAEDMQEISDYHIPITDITSDFVELYRAVHDAFEHGTYREFISKGGRGSIKSNFWAAVAEETIYNDPQAHVVYTRRYKTDLRGSVYHQFQKTIMRHDRADDWEFTTSPMMAKYKKTGQCVLFLGCDKPISLKSFNLPFGHVKMLIHEECDEMAGVEQMDNVEDTFLRNDVNAIDVKVFNPPKSANNFMNKYTAECKTKKGTFISHSYYYNVPVKWLGQRFFDRAEDFKHRKPKYYANNYLGEVVGTGGGIFENVEERTITDIEIDNMNNFHYGLDFGYTHPQTFVKCSYDYEKDIIYVIEEVFAKKCKNSTFANKIKKYKNVEIICDSARPDNIAEMQDWGFDAVGAVKRWQNKGRDYCWEWLQQASKIVVDPSRCPNMLRELTTLEHEQLKDGTFSSAYPTLDEDMVMALIYSLNRVIMDHTRVDTYNNDNIEYESEE